VQCKSSSEIVLRPAADAAFALLDGRSVLFSETKQKIYELDQLGAFIWCRLAQDASLEDIYQELGKLGVDERTARQFARKAMDAWFDRALLEVDWRMSVHSSLSVNLNWSRISFRAGDRDLLKQLASLFCTPSDGAGADGIAVDVIEHDGQTLFRGDDGYVQKCEIEALLPAIKAYITERMIRSDRSTFALHAASLAKGGLGLLLCGEPGAGKSTLTLQLVDAGFQYAGDDVALIGADGMVYGIPFALTIKPGSWELLSRLRSDLHDVATYRRPDAALVRYVPAEDVHNGSLSVSWIIFLDRAQHGSVKLTPLDQLDSMKRLIASGFAADGKLSQTGFGALKRIVGQAKSFELTYCESTEARRVLMDLCDGRV
jgi:hypothetical protein